MKQQAGFTVTELMVVVAIAAILAATAAPSFRDMIRDNRLTASTNTLIAHLALARSEAVKTRNNVVICPRAAGAATCSANPADWQSGWLIYENVCTEAPPVFSGAACADGTDRLIKQIEGVVAGNLTMAANATAGSGLVFQRDGTLNLAFGAAGGSFALCDPRGANFGRQVDVSRLGRPKLHKGEPAGAAISSCSAPAPL